jgi:hypothetical protein
MNTLEATELDQAREYFNQTHDRVLAVTQGLSEAQFRFKPAPDRWSIAEILEHMVMTEERILGPVRELLAQAPAPPADHDCRLIDSIVFSKIPDRTIRAKAPEAIQPTGQWTLAATCHRFSANYRRLHDYVATTSDLRAHAIEAPPLRAITEGAFSIMDAYQWAIAVAAHDERHVRQILEIKDDPNYPA